MNIQNQINVHDGINTPGLKETILEGEEELQLEGEREGEKLLFHDLSSSNEEDKAKRKDKEQNAVLDLKTSQTLLHMQYSHSEDQPLIDSLSQHIDSGDHLGFKCNQKHGDDYFDLPKVAWDQSDSQIILKIYLRNCKNTRVSVDSNGKILNFATEVELDRIERSDLETKHYKFCFELYSQVVAKNYQCNQLSDYLLLELDKLHDKQLLWPFYLSKEEESQKQDQGGIQDIPSRQSVNVEPTSDVIDNEQAGLDEYQITYDSDRVCFEGCELYLSELLNQLPGPSTEEDWSTNLGALFKSFRSAKSKRDISVESKITQPEFSEDIFNPFRKTSHNLRPRTKRSNKMKYDYRRQVSSDSGSAINSGKNTAKHALDYRKTYLFLYNVLLFVLFLMVFMILVIKVISRTIDDDSVQGSAFIIKLLTYLQLLESIHPVLGLVPGGPMMPLIQVLGRMIVNLFLTEPAIRIDSAPYAHYLFIVWSCIEIFRYSFYALRVFKVDVYPLTWCRYTLFVPLYPLGGFCESQVVLSTIKYYGKTGAYSVSLPNAANMSFNLPIFLRFYTIFILGPSIIILMRYMWSQRCKQLGKEKLA